MTGTEPGAMITSLDAAKLQQIQQRARLVYSASQVELAISAVARQISARLADLDPLVLVVMTGAMVFAGRLLPQLQFPLQLDYLHCTRYRGNTVGAGLQWKALPSLPVKGRTVLLLDDILDEGVTLAAIRDWCNAQGATAVFTAVLVDKRHGRRLAGISADFSGLQSADHYLYGYGMDYKGYFRNAAGIFAVDHSDC